MRQILLIFVLLTAGCATTPLHPVGVNIPRVGVYHIVGSGQTLWRISKTYGIDMQDIMRANSIKDPNQIGVGEELFIPNAPLLRYVEPFKPEVAQSIGALVGPKHAYAKWRTITLHHSATLQGNAETFDRNHRSRKMGGLFYHFVIGNGAGSGDGELEVGWRWSKQRYVERLYDIQICLVGDFNRQNVTQAQFNTLVSLVSILRRQYGIPVRGIRRHQDLEGKVTECPGNNFPFSRLISELKSKK